MFASRRLVLVLVLIAAAGGLAAGGLAALGRQDADPAPAGRFVAALDGDAAPLRDAPVDLVLAFHDADGAPVPRRDWLDGGFDLRDVRFAADGAPVRLVPGAGAGVAIDDRGRLLVPDVVLGDAPALVTEDGTTPLFARTIPGWTAVLPPLLAIAMAIALRQVLLALLAGIWVGAWALVGDPWDGFLQTVTERLPRTLADGHRVSIVIFSCLLGAVVALVARLGGTRALVDAMTRLGESRRGAQVTTWLSGIVIFFDDYANALLVGNTMRPITDRFRVSREKLAYIVDATSAPVACICIISTWIAAEIGYIQDKLAQPAVREAIGVDAEAGYRVFIDTVPYNFYPIFSLVFGLAVVLLGRDYGPMLRAERRALEEGKLLRDGARPLSSREMDELVPVDPARIRWWNAVLPIGVVLVTVIATLWTSGANALEADGVTAYGLRDVFGAADSYAALLLASILGVATAVVLAVGQRLLSLADALDVGVAGIKAMMPAILVLVLAWGLQDVCAALGTSGYLVHHVAFTASFLPAVIFLLAAVIGFSTGTSWGTMGILVPLTMDYVVGSAAGEGLGLADTYGLMVASIGGVLAGAVFGDHCSPISDTTIMSSMSSGCDHVDHVRTQLPYALTVAAVALAVGYLPAGFGISPMISLPVGALCCVAAVRLVGRPATR